MGDMSRFSPGATVILEQPGNHQQGPVRTMTILQSVRAREDGDIENVEVVGDLLLLSHLNMELEMTAKLEIEPKVNFRAYVRDGHLRPADYEEGAVLVLTNAAPYPVAPQPQRAAPGIQNNNNHIININTNPSPFGTEVLELAGAVAGAALATANGTGGSAVAIGARALRRDFVATNIAVPSSHSPQQDSNTSPTITPRRGVDQGQYRLPPFQRNQEQARHAQAAAARRVSRQGSRYNPLARR